MEKLIELENIVKENLKISTDTGNIKEIKAQTKNLDAVKLTRNLYESFII